VNRKTRVWNVDFSHVDLKEALSVVKEAIRSHEQMSIAFVNPHSQVVASKDAKFRQSLEKFSMILADGVGVVIGSRLVGDALPARISGPAFFRTLSIELNREHQGVRYFFLGSTDDVLRQISDRIESDYPGVVLAGTYSPPMGDFSVEDEREILSVIRKSKADVLWVGMTAPKQEKWISECGDGTGVSVVAGIGAEFDYYAGTKKRPPSWISNMGLQWLHRFIQEPRRTWRRHVISAPVFLFNVLRQRRDQA